MKKKNDKNVVKKGKVENKKINENKLHNFSRYQNIGFWIYKTS